MGDHGNMELTFDVDVADLAATRFATSPLVETIMAVQVLADPRTSSVNLPWARWARAQLDAQAQLDRPLRLRAGQRRCPDLVQRPAPPAALVGRQADAGR